MKTKSDDEKTKTKVDGMMTKTKMADDGKMKVKGKTDGRRQNESQNPAPLRCRPQKNGHDKPAA